MSSCSFNTGGTITSVFCQNGCCTNQCCDSSSNDDTLVAIIVASVIGGLILLLLLALCLWCILRKRKDDDDDRRDDKAVLTKKSSGKGKDMDDLESGNKKKNVTKSGVVMGYAPTQSYMTKNTYNKQDKKPVLYGDDKKKKEEDKDKDKKKKDDDKEKNKKSKTTVIPMKTYDEKKSKTIPTQTSDDEKKKKSKTRYDNVYLVGQTPRKTYSDDSDDDKKKKNKKQVVAPYVPQTTNKMTQTINHRPQPGDTILYASGMPWTPARESKEYKKYLKDNKTFEAGTMVEGKEPKAHDSDKEDDKKRDKTPESKERGAYALFLGDKRDKTPDKRDKTPDGKERTFNNGSDRSSDGKDRKPESRRDRTPERTKRDRTPETRRSRTPETRRSRRGSQWNGTSNSYTRRDSLKGHSDDDDLVPLPSPARSQASPGETARDNRERDLAQFNNAVRDANRKKDDERRLREAIAVWQDKPGWQPHTHGVDKNHQSPAQKRWKETVLYVQTEKGGK